MGRVGLGSRSVSRVHGILLWKGGERMEFLVMIGWVLSVDEYCREGGDFEDWELERERERGADERRVEGREELLKVGGLG